MSVFRVNGKPLKFDLVGLSEKAFKKIEKIITENGGEIEHNDKQPIKFTDKLKFSCEAYPSCKLYSTKFIIDCAYNDIIVDPSPYRIGTRMLYDDCIMHHFLYGISDCCPPETIKSIVKTEPPDLMEEEENISEAVSGQNVASSSKESSSEELSHPQESNVSLPNTTSDDSETDFDQSDKEENLLNPHFRRSLRLKNMNSSVAEETRNEISETNHLPKQSIAGFSSGKRINLNFIPDSDHEESTFSEGQESDEDDESEKESAVTDDTDETPRWKKKACGPKITSEENRAIVEFLVENRVIGSVATGLLVWKKMIECGICRNHSPYALQKHFYRYILPRIRTFELTDSQLKRFDRLVK